MGEDRTTVAVDGSLLDDLAHLGGLQATDPDGILTEALDVLRAHAVSADNLRHWLGLPGSASDGAVKAEIVALTAAGVADPAQRFVFDAVASGRIHTSQAAFWRHRARAHLETARAMLAAMPAGVWQEADSAQEAGLSDQNGHAEETENTR
jgi:hypothetical protein